MNETNTDIDSTDAENSDAEDLSPQERKMRTLEKHVDRKNERRRKKNAPLDLEDDEAIQTGTDLKIVEAYEECLDRGMTAVAARLQNPSSKSKQQQLAATVRRTEYQVSAAELDERPSKVRARYQDDDDG